MDPDELAQMMELGEIFGAGTNDSSAVDTTVARETFMTGSPTDALLAGSELGLEASNINKGVDLAKERDEQRAAAAQAVDSAEKGLDLINSLLDDDSYKIMGGTSKDALEGWFGAIARPINTAWAGTMGTPGYGATKSKMDQLVGQGFLSNIGKMQGMGSLSNAEGQAIMKAAMRLTAVTEVGGASLTEREIKKILEEMRTEFQKSAKRNTAGMRIDPETQKEIPIEEFRVKYPDIAIGPNTVPTTATGQLVDLSSDTRDMNLIWEDIRVQLNDPNVPAGTIFRVPGGRTFTKKATE